jgi:toxin CcdB
MSQFDVFRNPVTSARRAYPFVVVLQSDLAGDGRQRAVAPAAPRTAFPAIAGRLTPIVRIERRELVLLVTGITTLPANSLDKVVASLAERRSDILAAIDYLFFGV